MKIGHTMTTLSEAMNKMNRKGYDKTFEMKNGEFKCNETGEIFKPEDVSIVKVFRFEGESNPDDMAVLYVIETNNELKGQFVDAYGTYADFNEGQALAEFLKKVNIVNDH